jgi:hypothetical protein
MVRCNDKNKNIVKGNDEERKGTFAHKESSLQRA